MRAGRPEGGLQHQGHCVDWHCRSLFCRARSASCLRSSRPRSPARGAHSAPGKGAGQEEGVGCLAAGIMRGAANATGAAHAGQAPAQADVRQLGGAALGQQDVAAWGKLTVEQRMRGVRHRPQARAAGTCCASGLAGALEVHPSSSSSSSGGGGEGGGSGGGGGGSPSSPRLDVAVHKAAAVQVVERARALEQHAPAAAVPAVGAGPAVAARPQGGVQVLA